MITLRLPRLTPDHRGMELPGADDRRLMPLVGTIPNQVDVQLTPIAPLDVGLLVFSLATVIPLVTLSAVGLPAGLTMDAAGLVTGTTPAAGPPQVVTVRATNTAGSSQATFSWEVTP